MIIDNAGTYTLRYTATDDCGKTTTVDRELVVEQPAYGIEWNYTSSPTWTRIGASADFANPVPQYSDGNGGWIGGSSPFDNIMPWSGMQIVEDATIGTLVSIPKYYYKLTHNTGEPLRLEISMSQADGFLVSPAHADRGDGVGERDVVYVARYACHEIDFKSISNAALMVDMARSAFRTGIHNLGSDVWQYDYAMFWTIAMLYLVEFADWDSQKTIGLGTGNGSSKTLSGFTDSMQYHTGTSATSRSEHGHVQYRHIEDLWANVLNWCDGIYTYQSNVYCINNPSDFSDNANGTLIAQRGAVNGTIRNFTYPTVSGFEYALFPSNIISAGSNSYVCDAYDSYNTSGTVAFLGGSYKDSNTTNTKVGAGLFRMNNQRTATYTNSDLGSRLMKLPSA